MDSKNTKNLTSNAKPTENMSMLAQPKKHYDKRTVAVIVLAILALSGVGFGVFGMVSNGQANQRADALDSELGQKSEALKQAEEKLGAQIEIKPEAELEESDQESGKKPITEVQVLAARDYIYIGEWGIKIKVPEDLVSVTYHFIGGRGVLYVAGAKYREGGMHYHPSFLEDMENHSTGLGVLERHAKNNDNAEVQTDSKTGEKFLVGKNEWFNSGGVIVYEDDDYYYTYSGPHAVAGEELDRQWEADSAQLIADMFKHNISAF